MIPSLITLLIAALVLYLIYWFATKMGVSGTPLQIIGIVLLLVLILVAMRTFGVSL